MATASTYRKHKHLKTAFSCKLCKSIVKKARKMLIDGKTWSEIEMALTDRQWDHFELNYALIYDATFKQQCSKCKGIFSVANTVCPFCPAPSWHREYVYQRQLEPQRTPDPTPVVEQVPVAENRKASQSMIDSLYSRATREEHKGNFKLADHLRSEARKREANVAV